ncbi:MAG: cell wall-binding repeat-containing protein [Acidimicrobiales bacterium]
MRLNVTKLGRMTAAAVAGLTASVGFVSLAASPASAATVNRNYAGATRFDTSAMIAEAKFPTGVTSKNVVMATGFNFPDALAGNYLAGQLSAPILLTPGSTSDPNYAGVTVPALAKLLPSKGTVTILGQTLAVGADVSSDLTSKGYTVVRVGGANRYDTAQSVDTQSGQTAGNGVSGAPTGILATGVKFPDALVAGSLAFKQKFPIILTDGTQSTLGSQAAAAISANKITHLIVMGGDAAISPSILTSLPAGVTVDKQFKGVDRTDTAGQALDYAIATYGFPSSKVFLASGGNFPDALSSGPLGGDPEGTLLTEPDGSLGTFSTAEFAKVSPATIDILGGVNAVSDAAGAAAKAAAEGGGFTATTNLPTLTKASFISTTSKAQATSSNLAGSVFQFVFSQSLATAAFVAGAFHVYPGNSDVATGFPGSAICNGTNCAASTNANAVNVLFDPALGFGGVANPLRSTTGVDGSNSMTLATVSSGGTAPTSAVTTTTGAFNPAGAVKVGTGSTLTPSPNATSAPNFVSFGTPRPAAAANSSAIDLTFDKAAAPTPAGGAYKLVFANGVNNHASPPAPNDTNDQEVTCTGPTGATPSTTQTSLSSAGWNPTNKTVTIVCPNPAGAAASTITAAQIGWIAVLASSVQTTDTTPIPAAYIEASTPQANVDPVVRLTNVTLNPGSGSNLDFAVFAFSQPVDVATVNPGLFALVKSDGTVIAATGGPGSCTMAAPTLAGQCQTTSNTTSTTVLLTFATNTIKNGIVVGGQAAHLAVTNANHPALPAPPVVNADDELGAPNSAAISQTPGTINSIQLTSTTVQTGTNGLGQSTTQATYTFSQSVCAAATAACAAAPTAPDNTKFHLYDADGTELTCAAAFISNGTGAADNTVICTSYNQGTTGAGTAATSSQMSGVKLATVDFKAVTGNTAGNHAAANNNPNPEGAANT